MNKLITVIGLVLILISVLASCTTGAADSSTSQTLTTPTETPNEGGRTTWDAPITINQNSEGQILRVNLVKFAVNASAKANITINDIPAIKDIDGTYYALLDLTPGANTIEVKTGVGNSANLQETRVTFSPPLFVYLNSPQFETTGGLSDYNNVPVNITGYVSNPQAEVKVNDILTNVNADGTFAIELPWDDIAGLSAGSPVARVIATTGNESDLDWSNLFIENGKVGISPAGGINQSTQFDPGDLTVNPGKSIRDISTLRVLKDVEPGAIARFDLGGEIPGIKITIDPAKFSIYPNIDYSIPIAIQADKNITPGTYRSFTLHIGNTRSMGPVNINVVGPNGG